MNTAFPIQSVRFCQYHPTCGELYALIPDYSKVLKELCVLDRLHVSSFSLWPNSDRDGGRLDPCSSMWLLGVFNAGEKGSG